MKLNDNDYRLLTKEEYEQWLDEQMNPNYLGELSIGSAGLLKPTTYKVIRFYKDWDRASKVILTGLTLDEAQAHCRREDTRGDDWFDGYEEEK